MNVPIPLRPDRDALRETAMTSLARAVIDTARAYTIGGRYKSGWPEDRVTALLTRAATTPTTMADMAALKNVAVHFLSSLLPVSAASAVLAQSLKLNFDNAAQLRLPSLTLPFAQWTGEGKPIRVVQGNTTAGPLIDPAKLTVIVPLTGEMIRNSAAEAIVRQVLMENSAVSLDAALFSATAATPISPAGILNGIAPLPPSAAGLQLDAMIEDIGNIAAAVAPASGASTPVLVAAPRQAVALAMAAPRDLWPVLMSAALPDKTLIGVVPAGIGAAIQPPKITASSETLLHMEDDAPAEIVDGGGTLAYPVISMFQADSVALRFIMPATWGRRSASSVAWIESVAW